MSVGKLLVREKIYCVIIGFLCGLLIIENAAIVLIVLQELQPLNSHGVAVLKSGNMKR